MSYHVLLYLSLFKDIGHSLVNFAEKESNMKKMRVANSDKPVPFYSLDVIISVDYKVKSSKDTLFRKWVNNILKKFY